MRWADMEDDEWYEDKVEEFDVDGNEEDNLDLSGGSGERKQNNRTTFDSGADSAAADRGSEERGDKGRSSDDDEPESGRRFVVKKLDPREPTAEERREHELTHVPYRNWCEHCVKGRGKEEACRKRAEEESGVPEIHMDYMFMGEEHGDRTLAILVARERNSKAIFSTVVPRRTTGEWTSRRLMAWTREIGIEFTDLVVRTDNEPALVSLVETWSSLRAVKGGGKTVMEHSPVGSSKSNGDSRTRSASSARHGSDAQERD